MKLNNQVTFSHILVILGIIVIPLILYGVNIETRFVQVIDNKEDIEKLEKDKKESDKTITKNHEEVMNLLHKIELQLKDKKDK